MWRGVIAISSAQRPLWKERDTYHNRFHRAPFEHESGETLVSFNLGLGDTVVRIRSVHNMFIRGYCTAF